MSCLGKCMRKKVYLQEFMVVNEEHFVEKVELAK
jgi:hypothetical protein